MTALRVDGYCWPQSVAPGEPLALHLSSSEAQVQVEVHRIGAGRTPVWSGQVAAGDHPIPPDAASAGCDWPVATTVDTTGWESGYHEVTLTVRSPEGELVNRAFTVVRPGAASDRSILLVLSTNTWHAYNDFGGDNLYTGGTTVALKRPMGKGFLYKPPGAGRRVASTNVPDPQHVTHIGYLFLNDLSFYAGSAGWPNWELPFVQWAEQQGYAVDVATSADLEEHPELLGRYRLMLSVGHDEYWSGPARDTVESFVAAGGNVAFLSGNTAFWQVRLEQGGTVMVGYKQNFADDPVYGTERQGELTGMWSDRLVERPENTMTGVSFARGGYARIGRRVTAGSGGFTVHRPEHWLFEGTGLVYGDILGGSATVVGYECDGCDFTYVDGLPVPTHSDGTPAGFEILGTSPAQPFGRDGTIRPLAPDDLSDAEFHAWRVLGSHDAESTQRLSHGHAVLGLYTRGGTVVTSGSTEWVHGLAERDTQVEQVTRNLLDTLSRPVS